MTTISNITWTLLSWIRYCRIRFRIAVGTLTLVGALVGVDLLVAAVFKYLLYFDSVLSILPILSIPISIPLFVASTLPWLTVDSALLSFVSIRLELDMRLLEFFCNENSCVLLLLKHLHLSPSFYPSKPLSFTRCSCTRTSSVVVEPDPFALVLALGLVMTLCS